MDIGDEKGKRIQIVVDGDHHFAAGQQPRMGFDLLHSMETMTAYIVQVSLGDTPQQSIEYSTLFAVGTLLFVMTFVMNVLSDWLVRRYREAYQ